MENKSVKIKARAKVNLALNICGVREGMHLLDSVLVSVDLYDELEVRFNNDGIVTVKYYYRFSGDRISVGENDTVTRALGYLRSFIPNLGAGVTVRKGIPMGGGVGGSSADAAAVIFAANKLYGLPESVISGSVCVGSDVPAMCLGGALRLGGTGERVEKLTAPVLHLVVASKGKSVSTREAFAEFDRTYPSSEFSPSDIPALISSLKSGDAVGASKYVGNALTVPAAKLCPDIGGVLGLIAASGARASFMTGSGNCCCGLYLRAESAMRAAELLRSYGIRAEYAPSCDEGNTIIG